MRYYQRVTFQASTVVRDAAGGVEYIYENVPALTDLPARVTAVREEKRGERMVVIEDSFDILVAGEHDDITEDMAVLDGEAVYDVLRIAPFALGRRGRQATRVMAQRVAI